MGPTESVFSYVLLGKIRSTSESVFAFWPRRRRYGIGTNAWPPLNENRTTQKAFAGGGNFSLVVPKRTRSKIRAHSERNPFHSPSSSPPRAPHPRRVGIVSDITQRARTHRVRVTFQERARVCGIRLTVSVIILPVDK